MLDNFNLHSEYVLAQQQLFSIPLRSFNVLVNCAGLLASILSPCFRSHGWIQAWRHCLGRAQDPFRSQSTQFQPPALIPLCLWLNGIHLHSTEAKSPPRFIRQSALSQQLVHLTTLSSPYLSTRPPQSACIILR